MSANCHLTTFQSRVITYDTLPFSNSFISIPKVLPSPLANNPTMPPQETMIIGYTSMPNKVEKVSLFISLSEQSCTREWCKENVADAARAEKNPIICFSLGSWRSSESSDLALIESTKTDIVRRTTYQCSELLRIEEESEYYIED